MALATNLGFPRIGPDRELKRALEAFWAGKITEDQLREAAAAIRKQNWLLQKDKGLDHIPSNDFSLYDHVLDAAVMVGAVPERFGWRGGPVDMATYFAMARGVKAGSDPEASAGVAALEMTKWFDTNYHYMVPEFEPDQPFTLASTKPIDEFLEARSLGVQTRPVLLGPVTFLLLGKIKAKGPCAISLLDGLLDVYEQVLRKLQEAGADWVQLDEPALAGDLGDEAKAAYRAAYERLAAAAPDLRLLVATYFGDLRDNVDVALRLPVAALHVDLVRGPATWEQIAGRLPDSMALSAGVVDGRNIWKTDLAAALGLLEKVAGAVGRERLLIGPSCSLLHSPVDLEREDRLDGELKSWLAFAAQKLKEIVTLTHALNEGRAAVAGALAANAEAIRSRAGSPRVHNPAVKARLEAVTDDMLRRRSAFADRRALQRDRLNLPILPTTTIGSFPQTPEVRAARAAFRAGRMSRTDYEAFLRGQIEHAVRFQEQVGLAVLVHGEFERNDMVEYFGEQLQGFASTRNGWVQSYGSRCVKPPIIYGDIERTGPMTVEWARYAQSLTDRPVKGMLTGPVTMLQWSFVRDDQPRSATCRQLALAIRDEVADLEAAGIGIIQIDEPALREGLPLRRQDADAYLRWAVDCFRLASAGVRDETQIHTHMCYAQFNDIIEAIGRLDADVISIEASRSNMELLDAFARYRYPNDVGPGLFDVHSPRIPGVEEMVTLLRKALGVLDVRQLWVNPDCGLKTRRWEEVKPALANMVAAAEAVRREVSSGLPSPHKV